MQGMHGEIKELQKGMQGVHGEIEGIKEIMATREDLASTNESIAELEERMATKDELTKTNQYLARLENQMETNDKDLYDGYKLNYEKLILLGDKVDLIDSKLDSHNVKIRVIKEAR